MKASTSITIDRPVEQAFAFVADPETMYRWVIGVTQPKRTSEGEFGLGSTFDSKYTYRGKTFDVSYLATEFEPPTRYGFKSTAGPFPSEGLIELETAGTRTRVAFTIDAGSDSVATTVIFALFGPLIRMLMRRHLHKELEALKAVLESQ